MHNEIETPAQAGSNSLPDLAARIRAEHEAAEASYRKGIEHALVAGELLAEAKAKVQHGQWLSWLQNNCGISERMAQRYMKLHNERATLETKSDTVSDLTINEALSLVARPKPLRPDLWEAVAKITEPEDEDREARRLADAVREADANVVEAFVAKSRELREFAEMLDEFGEEFGEWEARALMKEVNKIPPTCKWSRSQVHRWKKRTDEQARAQAWQFIAELNYGRFDEEDLDEQDAA